MNKKKVSIIILALVLINILFSCTKSDEPITLEKVRYEEKENDNLIEEATYDKFNMPDTFALKYQALNAELLDFNAKNDLEAKKFLKENREEVINIREERQDDYMYFSNDSSVDIKRNDEKVFSFANALYCFLGGAHGSFGTACYNYDTKSGKILKNIDIITNINLFHEKLIKKLSADEYKEQLFPDFEDTIHEMFNKKSEFSILVYKDSIEVLFDPYLIGPWASSTISVKFDYNDNKDILNNKLFE